MHNQWEMPVTSESNKQETNSALEIFRDYVWGYFELHAEQRLKTFQFFITLATALVGAFIVLIRYGITTKWMAAIGVLVLFFSFVFWKLDHRTRQLIKNAEEALKYLDAQHHLPDIHGAPHPLRIFSHDDYITDDAKPYPLWSGHFSYSRCFEWVFRGFALAGIISTIWCLFFFTS